MLYIKNRISKRAYHSGDDTPNYPVTTQTIFQIALRTVMKIIDKQTQVFSSEVSNLRFLSEPFGY